jgi:hypothetical protein
MRMCLRLLLVLVVLSGGWGCAGPDAYSIAREHNLTDIADQAGKDYEREVGRKLRRDFANVLNNCTSHMSDPDLSAYEMIVTLDETGKVAHICYNLTTEVSECLHEALVEAQFSAPPRAPFRAHIGMRLE